MSEKPLALLRLLRFSNAPTTISDIVAGIGLGLSLSGTFELGRAVLVWLASLAIYEFGMVMNDVFDFPADRRQGRPRPLVTGALRRATAIGIGIGLAVSAITLLVILGGDVLWVGACLVAVVFLYDTVAKKNAVLGPSSLGLCRALNLLLGASAFASLRALLGSGSVWLVLLGYGLYVFSLSALARMEDGTVRPGRCRAALVVAGAAFALPGLIEPTLLGTPCHLLGAFVIFRSATGESASWERASVGRTVGSLLRLTVVYGAGVAGTHGAPWWVVLALLLLHPCCRLLARRIPPT